MLKKPSLWSALVLAAILGVACAPAPSPTATIEAPAETISGPTATDDAALEPSPPTPASQAEIPGRPDAPAAPDVYRADPAAWVAATGNPQLLEFFTYW